jgi:putative DNA primase/helicase
MTPLYEIEQCFKDYLASINHSFSGELNFDTASWERYDCPTSSKGNHNVSYKAHTDGQPCLIVQCHKCHTNPLICKYGNKLELTPFERAEIQRHAELKKSKNAKEKTNALIEINDIWNSAKVCTKHAYLDRKSLSITEYDGLRLNAQACILCPIRLITGELVSLQTIPFKGKKHFHIGTSPKNGFHVFGSIEAHDEIFFAEGIATALTIRDAVNKPVICVYGKHFSDIAPIIKKAYPNKQLIYCCDLPSNGEHITSEDNAKKAIALAGGCICLPDFSGIPNDLVPEISRSDFNDLLCLLLKQGKTRDDALAEVRRQIQQKTQQGDCMTEDNAVQKDNLIAEIKELALLDLIEYELVRKEKANKFGIREGMLDDFVSTERKKTEEEKSETILFPKIDPWPDNVSLHQLLNEIVTLLNKYVSFNSEHESRAIALWVIHTYCLEAAYTSPILFVTSAEMRSGKSTLLSILQKITYKCVAASSITPSVLYRLYSKHHPTIICDEADTYMTDKNEDLRGVLNAGHSRDTAGVLRTNPDTLEVERFDAFGAKCLAAIKGLPGTVEDRSIIIKMRRMRKGEKKEKMRLVNDKLRKEFQDIQKKCLKFANDNIEALKKTDPILPEELHDRAADNWHSLFQIASLADKKWQDEAKNAALELSGIKQENKSLGIELLEDILNIFDGLFKNDASITTIELIGALCLDDEAPWATYNSKRSDTKITPRQLANLLSQYGIKSKNNVGIENRKGYLKSDFQDAFSRYIHTQGTDFTVLSAPSAQPNHNGGSGEIEQNNLSATNRSIRYPLPQMNTQVADSACSGSERIKINPDKPSQAPSNITVADRADKSINSAERRYIDV